MNPILYYHNTLNRTYNSLSFDWTFNQEYTNYLHKDKDSNWAAYDRFTIGYSALNIPIIHELKIKESDFLENIELSNLKSLYKAFIRWQYTCSRGFGAFTQHVFRQSELIHGLMSLYSERFSLSVMFVLLFEDILAISEFGYINLIDTDIWFLSEKRDKLPVDFVILVLLQQCHIEKEIIKTFILSLKKEAQAVIELLDKWQKHVELQIIFLEEQLNKNIGLKNSFLDREEVLELPYIHYHEYTKGFQDLLGYLELFRANIKQTLRDNIDLIINKYNLKLKPKLELNTKETILELSNKASSKMIEMYKTIDQVKPPEEIENDRYLLGLAREMKKRTLAKFMAPVSLEEQYELDICHYYTKEMAKIKWYSSDVIKLIDENPITSLSDNDYKLLDVVKEIAFCEGFSYTIGYQNIMHTSDMHDFQLWNTNQCHEELKHYHAIRILLNKISVQTENMDEEFLATTFEEPSIDAYKEQYTVFMVNFLGETHNMRAYWLLVQAFDNPVIKKILEWIFLDEVVHKKVFARHFKKLCYLDRHWEKNSYENLIDHGLGIHQAMRCSRYHELMRKIGLYYAASGKTTALDFLNKSMRAQYLELKDLFSPELFQVSEYDFRKKHLKAYLL